jgi:hypothetical protein
MKIWPRLCCIPALQAPKAAASNAWHPSPPGFPFSQMNPLCSFAASEGEWQQSDAPSQHHPLGIPPKRRVCFAVGMAVLLVAAMLLAFLLPFVLSPGYVQPVLRGATPRYPNLAWIRPQTQDRATLPSHLLESALKASIEIDSLSMKQSDSSSQRLSVLLSLMSIGSQAIKVWVATMSAGLPPLVLSPCNADCDRGCELALCSSFK